MPTTSTIRKEIYKIVMSTLKTGQVNKNKIAAQLAIQAGWSKKKLLEIIDLFIESGEIQTVGENIKLVKNETTPQITHEDDTEMNKILTP